MKTYALPFLLILLFSCTGSTPTPTTDVFNSSEEYSSFSSSRSSSIIDRIYAEELNKNEDLKKLNVVMDKANKEAFESMKKPGEFMDNNKAFYNEALNYTSRLSDTALSARINSIIIASKADFEASTANITNGIDVLKKLQTKAEAYNTAVKIVVANHVMKQYQKSKPAATDMQEAANQLNNGIKQAESILSK